MRTMRRTPPTQVSQRKPRAHGKRPTRAIRRTRPLQPTTTRRTRPARPAQSTGKSAGRQPATRRWRLRGSGSAACYDAASGREASCDREPSAGLAAAQGERHACRANHRCIRRIACADVDASARRDRLRMQRVRSNGGTRVVRYFILRARVRIGSDEAPLLRRICVSSPVVSTRCRLLRDRVSGLEVKPSWRRGDAAPRPLPREECPRLPFASRMISGMRFSRTASRPPSRGMTRRTRRAAFSGKSSRARCPWSAAPSARSRPSRSPSRPR